MFESTVILIPAKNEEASVAKVVETAIACTGARVLVIDDASTDKTIDVAQNAGAIVIPLSVGLGAWGALQTGLRYAVKNNYQYAITMDADGQHDAQDLHALTEPVYSGAANVSIGACISRGSRLRKIAWIYLKHISCLSMEDITSGFRAYDRSAMMLLSGAEATLLEYQDIGVLTMLKEYALDIAEVEVVMASREAGHSRVFGSWFMVAYYMLHASILGISKRKFNSTRSD